MIYKTTSLLIFFILSFTLAAQDINKEDTRLLAKPAMSDSQIAFIYAEDLWVANKDGSAPKRLTVDDGIESNPVFSPDGSLIVFNAEYDGNPEVTWSLLMVACPSGLAGIPEATGCVVLHQM